MQALGHTLVICEKPDAARRIAHALGQPRELGSAGIPILEVNFEGQRFVFCSASGHLFGLADVAGDRSVFPVFDLEWNVVKTNYRAARLIGAISRFAEGATSFVHACDYDQEGEVIGYNVLQIACRGSYGNSRRAKFSTLTDEEIRSAFQSLEKPNSALADAGRARHVIDFIYGVNLSRALVASFKSGSSAYRNLSIGRVQGPTLAFAADREKEIKSFVAEKYWTVQARFQKGSDLFSANYENARIDSRQAAHKIVSECQAMPGKVTAFTVNDVTLMPPTPFNIGDLQRESYRLFRTSPSYTLAIAEKLYLAAMISYPRTSSQKIPASIGYYKIIESLGRMSQYGKLASMLLSKSKLVPHEGKQTDPAHPAIYATGRFTRKLSGIEYKVYDLIAKRFLAAFGDPARSRRTSASISVDGHLFLAEGRTVTYEGWMVLYKPFVSPETTVLPDLREGELLENRGVTMTEETTKPPPRYTQASLLYKMEQEKIGTKATRADIIGTLFKRNYLSLNRGAIQVTELGLSVVESMRKYVPDIVSTKLTSSMEEELEKIEQGAADFAGVIERAADELVESLASLREKRLDIGKEIRAAATSYSIQSATIGQCPACKTGNLMIIKSRATRKRFIGCSNYSKGCKASAPMPQRGAAMAAGAACKDCGWPKLKVKLFRRAQPWTLCVNMECPSREEKKPAA